MKISGVIFDLDGLMIDSEKVVMYSWNEAGNQMGYEKMGENLYHTLGMSGKSREAYFLNKYGSEFPFKVFRDKYREVFFAYEKEFGIPTKKGLKECLRLLAGYNIPMAVATSSNREYCINNLERHGIRSYFSAVITGDMVREAKPSPEIYRIACEKLGCRAEQTVALKIQ